MGAGCVGGGAGEAAGCETAYAHAGSAPVERLAAADAVEGEDAYEGGKLSAG